MFYYHQNRVEANLANSKDLVINMATDVLRHDVFLIQIFNFRVDVNKVDVLTLVFASDTLAFSVYYEKMKHKYFEFILLDYLSCVKGKLVC